MSAGRIITGKTGKFAVIGYPVEHSLSPAMHNAEFERLGLDYVYVPCSIEPGQLELGVRGLVAAGFNGFNVTIPHKQAIMGLLHEISEDAASAGAVNTVVVQEDGRLIGHNTDMTGWVADVQEDILVAKSSVCIVGAGGAARAIAAGALRAGASRLFICGRRPEALSALTGQITESLPGANVSWRVLDDPDCGAEVQGCDIIVNCTPVGMDANPGIPIPLDWLHPHQYVYDTIYTPAETELMAEARLKDCAVRGGLGMLAHQGAEAFKIWTGQEPDVDRMKATLRHMLKLQAGEVPA